MTNRRQVEAAAKASTIEPTGRHLILTLLSEADSDTAQISPTQAPTYTDLERMTGLSRSALTEWMRALSESGWIHKVYVEGQIRPGYALTAGDPNAARAMRMRDAKKSARRRPLPHRSTVTSQPVPKASEQDKPDVPTLLYWHYDSYGNLLYIGVTYNQVERGVNHAVGSSWVEFAKSSKSVWYPSRAAAEEAEQAAIQAERPLFNHVHNDTPEARQRLVDYLIRHGRTDLLAPAVSRG